MDRDTCIQQMKERVEAFCLDRDWDQYHGGKDLAIGVITEASELLEHFRFRSPEEVEALLADERRNQVVAEELVDVLFFVLRFAGKYHIDLSTALERKMIKTEAKYPVEKVRGKNTKYTEL